MHILRYHKKISVLTILILVFASTLFFYENTPATASENIYPLEIAIPDTPLTEGAEANFYIIVNDDELRKELSEFAFSFGHEAKQILPYDRQSYVVYTKKIPSLSYTNYSTVQTTVEAHVPNNDKFVYRIFKNLPYTTKFPIGPLPDDANAEVQKQIKEPDFDFVKLKWHKEWEGAPAHEHINPSEFSEYLQTDFIKTGMTEAELQEKIQKIKNNNLADRAAFHNATPKVEISEVPVADQSALKVTLITNEIHKEFEGGTWQNKKLPSTVNYYIEDTVLASVRVTTNSENDEPKYRVYPFRFQLEGSRVATDKYENNMKTFHDKVSAFARGMSLHEYTKTDYQEHEQTGGTRSSGGANSALEKHLKEYNGKELTHSDIYNQIMSGNVPGAETVKKEKKEVDNRKFTLTFRNTNQSTIWNTGVVNTGTDADTRVGITVNIQGTAYDKDGNIVEDISDEELYKGVHLISKILNPVSQLGFLNGSNFTNEAKLTVDEGIETEYLQSKGPRRYKGPYLPKEFVMLYLENSEGTQISEPLLYTVHVKDARPHIEMEKEMTKIHDNNDGVIKFMIKDDFHKKLSCTVKVPYENYTKNHIPIITVSKDGSGDTSTYIDTFECETNVWIPIRVRPPSLSNFDMLSEMNGLSMWKLQKGTAESFALDLVGAGIEARLDNLGKTKTTLTRLYEKKIISGKKAFERINVYENTMRTLKRANDMASNAQNAIKLTQVGTNIEGHLKDLQDAESGSSGKGWVEKTSDWGVAGINALQSTVGAIAMAPGHIPVVGKWAGAVTGKFTLAFNLMTNVWKGNLQYISKEKKLDRAEEKDIPYPITIKVESKDGFVDITVGVADVVYTYLENS